MATPTPKKAKISRGDFTTLIHLWGADFTNKVVERAHMEFGPDFGNLQLFAAAIGILEKRTRKTEVPKGDSAQLAFDFKPPADTL